MIKKIFSYIIIGIFILIPSFSFAKITSITTVTVNNSDITSNTAKVFGALTQDLGTGVTTPEKISAGFAGPIKSSQIITSCSQLPKPQLTQLTGGIIDHQNETTLSYKYNTSKSFSGLEAGETYYFCFAGIEGKDNKDSNQYTYGNVKSFTTKPTLEFTVNDKTEKVEINYGGNVKLNWESKGASLCFGRNDLSNINNGSQGISSKGEKIIEKIYERKVFTVECLSKNGVGALSKSIEITIKGRDEDKIGKVLTLPEKNSSGDYKEEPEVTVDVTDKSAKLKGKLLETKNDKNYAYFRISKVTIPPIFCNDIFGSNMIAVTANTQDGKNIQGGLINKGEFSGTIYTLEPDTDYAYCAIVSNHPTVPTEIEYGQVVRFRTNPCVNCPHTTVRTLRPTKISSESAILQGNYNSTRNIKVWFEYRPKWGGQYIPTIEDGGTFELPDTDSNNNSGSILKNRNIGLNSFNSVKIGLNLLKYLIKDKKVNAAINTNPVTNEWHILKDSEQILNKKRNYGRKQFTLTGLSRDTVYQYKIVAETIVDKTLYPNPNPEQRFEGAIVEFRTRNVNDGVNPLAHCYNGIQDFGETGVDTGGGCPGKAPSCDDGIQNGNETGIDQGGSCKDNSLNHCYNGIQDFGETGVDEGGDCDPFAPECPEGEICECPPGSTLINNQCIPDALPTCDDGIQNNGETGIDTGGSCPPASCVDGKKNQDETGIDTGGVCGEVAPDHCFNGVQDEDETGIDKGGSCGNDPRPNRCKNGIQDGDETGIDTGGRCGDKVVVEIKATSYYIPKGGRVTVSWTSTNADYCTVSNYKNGGQVGTSGEFSPIDIIEKQRTYTATCTSAKYGTGSDSITIFTYDATNSDFVSVDINANPTYLIKKGNVNITWTSKNAVSCIAHGPVLEGKTDLKGAYGLPDITKSSTWSVDCIGKNGDRASDSAFVFVDQGYGLEHCFNNIQDEDETGIDTGGSCGNKNDDKVTVDIKANPEVVNQGQGTVISWTSTNATSCVITDYKNGKSVEPNSSGFGVKLDSNKSYTATCKGVNDGVASDTVKVLVLPPTKFVTVDVKAEKINLNKGEGTVVSWTSTNATSCKSSGGGGGGTSGSFNTGNLTNSKTYNVTCRGGTNIVPNSDSVFIAVGYIDDNDGGGDNGTGGCPEGWLQEDGSCTPTYDCPSNAEGIWPNCKYKDPCPTSKGWSGDFWPNCKYTGGPVCPTGTTGTPPNCKDITNECGNGWTGTWPNCKFVTECPAGTTGEYPNCKIIDDGNGDGNDNGNQVCPIGTSGTYPNCTTNPTCPFGYTGNPPTCVAITNTCTPPTTGTYPNCTFNGLCPTGNGWAGDNWPNCTYTGNSSCPNGYTGTPPNCTFNFDDNNDNGDDNDDNGNNNPTCPSSMTGTYPNCTFIQTCPTGFTGTWPVCTSGPTTNIAHCSNGVQDFGETAIDIGGGCGGVYNGGATCFDNIKNGDETGVDEGGHCGDGPNNNGEYPSCFDNIKNGDETGIDIGGHCGNANTGTDWVDVVFPDANGTGTTTGTCVNGVCNGDWEGNFPGLNGPFSGSCRAGTYTDCTFTGNCVDGVCTGTWNGNFPNQNGPFVGTINGGIGDGRGLGNNDWLDSVFLNLAGEGTITGKCVNGICAGDWKGVCLGVNGPLTGIWSGETATGPYTGNRLDNKCSGKWSGVIAGNNGELIGKWKGDGIGNNEGKELYIGYEGIPDVDDIVRYHEGIEHVFIRRIMINTELARHYGYQKGQNLLHFAWDLAHTLAKEFGYVNSEGNEIRVSQPDVSAYQLRLVGDKLTVYEYYKNKIIDLRERTTVFKNKNSYEYYFETP